MKRTITSVFAFMILCASAFGWGREGHEVIAKIAERHLEPSAKKRIEKYLGNRSVVYYAKWMDDYRHTDEYKFTSPWHVASVGKDLKYAPEKEKGDAVYGINQAMEILRDYREHDDSTVCVNIKYLLHLVGDMHCPAHIKYEGRNQSFKVDFGGGYIKPRKEMNIHTVWDQAAIQSCRIWSVGDYAQEIDRLSRKEVKEIMSGTPEEWVSDNAIRCLVQFDLASEGENIAQDFVNAAMPLIETQMLYAGLRLAAVLNSLF